MRWNAGVGIWSCALLAWLAQDLVRGHLDRTRMRDAQPREDFALPRDPARMSARELRVLPGIGRRRALAIVAARRDHACTPDGFTWSDVPGVGPATEEDARAWLAARDLRQELCGCAEATAASRAPPPAGGRDQKR